MDRGGHDGPPQTALTPRPAPLDVVRQVCVVAPGVRALAAARDHPGVLHLQIPVEGDARHRVAGPTDAFSDSLAVVAAHCHDVGRGRERAGVLVQPRLIDGAGARVDDVEVVVAVEKPAAAPSRPPYLRSRSLVGEGPWTAPRLSLNRRSQAPQCNKGDKQHSLALHPAPLLPSSGVPFWLYFAALRRYPLEPALSSAARMLRSGSGGCSVSPGHLSALFSRN
mmetsp:Transcript_31091/g.60744  ORF Transcript_31091/g.60744 Transcript_31091/m.60744 type:complete len:223 (+) Transcript_31091:883-1551(+)